MIQSNYKYQNSSSIWIFNINLNFNNFLISISRYLVFFATFICIKDENNSKYPIFEIKLLQIKSKNNGLVKKTIMM